MVSGSHQTRWNEAQTRFRLRTIGLSGSSLGFRSRGGKRAASSSPQAPIAATKPARTRPRLSSSNRVATISSLAPGDETRPRVQFPDHRR